jgi:hypothetical protein
LQKNLFGREIREHMQVLQYFAVEILCISFAPFVLFRGQFGFGCGCAALLSFVPVAIFSYAAGLFDDEHG